MPGEMTSRADEDKAGGTTLLLQTLESQANLRDELEAFMQQQSNGPLDQ
jgi:hypothetical protein